MAKLDKYLGKKKKEDNDNKNLKCRICKTNRRLIHKYGLNICGRCFREVAPKIGFEKFC